MEFINQKLRRVEGKLFFLTFSILINGRSQFEKTAYHTIPIIKHSGKGKTLKTV